MANNNNFRLNGLNPLAYMGVNPNTPVPFFSRPDDPTINDYANFILGTIWLNTANLNIWMLVKLASFQGTWVKLGTAAGNLQTLTGDTGGAVSPISDNINILANTTAGSSVIFSGTPGNLKLVVTDANANTIIGFSAGNSSITGSDNTALGFSALGQLLSGSSNVAIGEFAGDAYTGAESNNIVIGNDGVVADADTIRIGDTQTSAYMAGIYGVNPSSNQVASVNSSGKLGSFSFADNNGDIANPVGGLFNIVGDGTTCETAASAGTITITAMGGGGGGGTSASFFGTAAEGDAISSTSGIQWIGPYAQATSTQDLAEFIVPAAGTINHLYVYATANTSTTDVTVTINKNGVNTAVVATVTALTTGTFSDLAHSFSVVAGDRIQFEAQQSTTGTINGNISAQFNSASGGGTVVDVIGGNNITITGTSTLDPVVNVSGTTNHCVQIGNSTGSLTSVANGTTGQFLAAQTGADPIWATATSGSICFLGYTGPGTLTSTLGTVWRAPFSTGAPPSTQISQEFPLSNTGTISNLYVYVNLNYSTVDTTITVNKNGTNTSVVATIPALTVGLFSDTTHSFTVVAGDLIQFEGSQSVTGNTSGNICVQFTS